MPIFLTYARKDRQQVEALVHDLERARNAVWMDSELTGGQVWWDTILGQIRACDLYVFALSPESLSSRACRLELEYALALKRPLLAVLIRDVAIATAPPAVANTQIIDYRHRTIDSGIALVSAVANRPAAPGLPDPLPVPPAPPVSYMNEFRDLLDAPDLSYTQQRHLLVDLRGYLREDDDRDTALELIRSLRARPDIVEGIGREIDTLLSDHRASQAGMASNRQPTSGPQHPVTPPAYQHPNQPRPQPTPPAYPPAARPAPRTAAATSRRLRTRSRPCTSRSTPHRSHRPGDSSAPPSSIRTP